jgi:hypothetical protein
MNSARRIDVHSYDDIRETYGDNPNGRSDEERLIARRGRTG